MEIETLMTRVIIIKLSSHLLALFVLRKEKNRRPGIFTHHDGISVLRIPYHSHGHGHS